MLENENKNCDCMNNYTSQMNTNMSDSEIKMTSEEMFDSYKINSFKDDN